MQYVYYPTENVNNRKYLHPDMIILHYTGMKTAQDALERLTDSHEPRVSSHYFVTRKGEIYHLADEKMRAWHAGLSFWKGEKDINSRSIGIELENKGHEFGYEDFSELQISALKTLIKDIKSRHHIPPTHILAHSDIAPLRKKDPGEKFPWHILMQEQLVPMIKSQKIRKKGRLYPLATPMLVREVVEALRVIGYKTDKVRFFSKNNRAALVAFQRHFMPYSPPRITEQTRIMLQKVKYIYGVEAV